LYGALFKNNTDSTTALGIQNAAGNNLLTADTANMSIIVSNSGIAPTFAAKADSTAANAPWGPATGDFNGDGRQDIIVTNSSSSSASVYINSGGSIPGSATSTLTTGGTPRGVATGDFNGDGKTDAIVLNATGSASVYINSGTALPTTATSTLAGSSPQYVATGDFNGDGKTDAVITNNSTNTASVFINSGTALPTTATSNLTTGTSPLGIAVADINGDNYPDVLVVNNSSTTVSVYVNASGTLPTTASYTLTTGSNPQQIAAADINGDGKPDVVVTNATANTASVYINSGTTLPTSASYTLTTGASPFGIIIGDFNGDALNDAATVNTNGVGSISIFANSGSSLATTASTTLFTGSSPKTAAYADFNADGKNDIVATNSGATTVSLFRNTTPTASLKLTAATQTVKVNSTSALSVQTSAGNQVLGLDTVANMLTLGGVNGAATITSGNGAGLFGASTDLTIKTGDNAWGVGTLYLQGGTNTFSGAGGNVVIDSGSGSGSSSVTIGAGSTGSVNIGKSTGTIALNGIVNNEVTFKNASDSTAAFQIQNSNASTLFNVDTSNNAITLGNTLAPLNFGSVSNSGSGTTYMAVTSADINGDGKPDAIGLTNSTTASVFINSGSALPASTTTTLTGLNAPIAVATGDFNGDGKTDAIIVNFGGNTASVFINTGSALPTTATSTLTLPAAGISVVTGDFNADGKTDAAVGSYGSGSVWVYTNTGAALPTTVSSTLTAGASSGARLMATGDINGDGKLDLAVPNDAGGGVSVYINSGAGLPIVATSTLTSGTSTWAVATGDFNGDGKTDLVASYASISSPYIGAYINTGAALPTSATYTSSLGNFILSTALVTGDFNGDGRIDAVTVAGTSGAKAFLNTGSALPSSYNYTFGAGTISGSSSNTENAVADFNGDGKLDLASIGTGTTGLAIYTNGSVSMSVNVAAVLKVQNPLNSTTAFQIQNASGANLFAADTSNMILSLNGANSGALNSGGWQATSAVNVSASLKARRYQSSVVYNGYVYYIAGNDGTSATAATNTVYYARLNVDGTIPAVGAQGTWAATTSLPVNRQFPTSVVANGYLYVIGGSDNTTTQSTVYYTKINSDGTLGASWNQANSINVGAVNKPREGHSSVVANGYLYVIGGWDGAAMNSTTYYAKLNADGTLGAWNSTTAVNGGSAVGYHTSVVANGYVYVIGGNSTNKVGGTNAATLSTVYFAKLNSDGTVGTWTSTTPINGGTNRQGHMSVVMNGNLYVIGGSSDNGPTSQTTVYYAPLNADGTISGGSWQSTSALTTANAYGSAVTANGYIELLGGFTSGGGITQSTVNYISGSRIKVGGSLDLVGLGGKNLAEGGTGGELTAGNTNIIGSFNVTGSASFAQGASVGGNFSVAGDTTFRSSINSATAFQVQNSSGASLLTSDTSSMKFTVNGSNGSVDVAAVNMLSAGAGALETATGDFNGDGKMDAIVTNFSAATASVFINTGTGLPATPNYTLTTGTNPWGVATGDFNGDGKTDAVVVNNGSTTAYVYINTGTTLPTTVTTTLTGLTSPRYVATGDFNGDGKTDAIITNNGASTASVYQNTGTGLPAAATSSLTALANPSNVVTGDFNGDGKTDALIVHNNGSTTANVYYNTGSALPAAASATLTTGTNSFGVATGDFNGDGKTDVIIGNYNSNTATVYSNSGSGLPSTASYTLTGLNGPWGVATGDFNGDGKTDVSVTNDTGPNVAVFLNSGVTLATTASFTQPTSASSPRGIATADFNSDGFSDVVSGLFGGNNAMVIYLVGAGSTAFNVNGVSLLKTTSKTALTIQNASSGNLLTADTTNMRLGVNVTYAAMGTPSGLAVGAATAGGSLTASAVYKYKVTAIDSAGGETAASSEASGTVGASGTQTLPVTWTAVTGASGYRVYRTAANGAANSEVYLTTVLTNSFTDTGSLTAGTATPPSTTTAYVSTNVSNSSLQLSVGGNGTPTGQLYVSGTVPTSILGSAGTSKSALAVQGKYAYMADQSNSKLTIYDLSNPASPTLVSNVASGTAGCTTPISIAVSGKYAYLGNDCNFSLTVFDISNPASPVNVSGDVPLFSAVAGDPNDLFVSGRYLYAVTSGGAPNQLQVIDIANPAMPVQVGAVTIGASNAVYVAGNYAYVANYGNNRLEIINISNPASPSIVSNVPITGSGSGPWDVYVQGKYAYVAGRGNLQIVDISNPASGSIVGTYTPAGGAGPYSVYVQGRYAYFTDTANNAIYTVDVSNPASPSLVGNLSTGSAWGLSLTVQGRYAYTAGAGNGLMTFDLGGAYIQQLQVGGIETGTLSTNGNATIIGSTTIQGGLAVGGTTNLQSNLNVGSVLAADTINSVVSAQGINSVATLGSELNTNTNFSTQWTATGWTTTSTTAQHNTGNTNVLSPTTPITIVAGNTYQVVFTIASRTAGTVTPGIGGQSGQPVEANSTNETQLITASTTGNLTFTPSSTFDGVISAVSVKIVTKSSNVLSVKNSDGTTGLEIRAGGSNKDNSFVGLNAGTSNTTGTSNTALGASALQSNTTGFQNTAIGVGTLQVNTTGARNTAIGINAMPDNTTGWENVAIGDTALWSNTTGSNNVGLGQIALAGNTSGSQNVGLGYNTLYNNTTGNNNIAVGIGAGLSLGTGSNNSFLGYSADTSQANLQNSTAIGVNSYVSQNDSLVLGCISGTNGCTATTKVGIGTSAPGATLDVRGDVVFKNTSATAFIIQSAAPTTLFTADTSGMVIKVSGTTSTFATLQLDNAHFKSTQTNAPTIGIPTNCGTGGTAATAAMQTGSTDSAGSFRITSDTAGAPTTCDTVITFNKAYGAAPKSVIVVAETTDGGTGTASARQIYVSGTSTTTFTVKMNSAPANGEVNWFYYWVVE
jgi:hypothetical protein